MRIDEPLMTLWFGNFYRPAYDDRDFVDESARAIRDLGFNCVLLDSKAWEDFRERFHGGAASQYVAQQEYLMQSLHREELAHMFLSLYLNGDNLYPNIRFSAPIHGDSVVNMDGTDGRWYRYWSPKARQSQQEHVEGLMSLYRDGHAETPLGLPMCSMWDPIVAPSFDEEGQARYRAWLKKRYGDIAAFNAAYQTDCAAFEELPPQAYWFTVRYGEGSCYALSDLQNNTPAFTMWADNMRWLADELTLYFADMQKRLHEVNPALYLMPNMAQWSHLLNIDTSRKSDIGFCELWDTAMRGIDMRALAPHVDMCHYYTVPVTIDGDADAYVVSCQHAHIRSLNQGRPFLGGIYWGRFLYSDVYRYVTPEEVIGSMVASGVSGISAYGWGGMDDGGLLHRMDEGFCESLKKGNEWAKNVIPRLGARRRSRVAILYPTAMALLEPLKVEGADSRRNDLLGLYHLCCDLGFAPDLVEKQDVVAGLGCDVLLIAADDCYHAQRDEAMEEALRQYAARGGVIIHGQHGEAAECAFGLALASTQSVCYTYQEEGGLLLGAPYVSYPGRTLAAWREDGRNCISRTAFGKGCVYSFGFMPGYQYAARTAPHVPLSQRNNALYPFTHMRHNPLKKLLISHAQPDTPIAMKDVECAAFEGGLVVVNHRSTPVTVMEHTIQGHSALFLEAESNEERSDLAG
ncbi:MAG: beta-galactosidase [bacterium]|nr:beta-galactosidase [bacterium]